MPIYILKCSKDSIDTTIICVLITFDSMRNCTDVNVLCKKSLQSCSRVLTR